MQLGDCAVWKPLFDRMMELMLNLTEFFARSAACSSSVRTMLDDLQGFVHTADIDIGHT